jgi:pentatricopeptide repeat protein
MKSFVCATCKRRLASRQSRRLLKQSSAPFTSSGSRFTVHTSPVPKKEDYFPANILESRDASIVDSGTAQLPLRTPQRDENVNTAIDATPALSDTADDFTPRLLKHLTTRDDTLISAISLYTDTEIIKALKQAIQQGKGRKVEDLWTKLLQRIANKKDPLQKISIELYNEFMHTYIILRQPRRSIDVWNHMQKAGESPNLVTWQILLEGCRRERNAQSVEEVWQMMVQSGVQPDIICWTTRIHALIKGYKWQLGIKALDDMGSKWKAAVDNLKSKGKHKAGSYKDFGDIEDVVKPNTELVNAVISALIRQGKGETGRQRAKMDIVAQRVLEWAASLGIPSDISTINTLLQPLIRGGNYEGAMELLQRSRELGINPDTYTLNIFIDVIFKSSRSNDTNEETEAALTHLRKTLTGLLNEFEKMGVKGNVHTYGSLIDNLLKLGNLRAANALFYHMTEQEISPSPYIYTSFFNYHFSRNPPDLKAVDSLWNTMQMERVFVDNILYDRLIDGYAKANDVGKAMAILGRMTKEKRKPGWGVLGEVLLCLGRAGQWQLASDVVTEAKRAMLAGEPLRRRDGEDYFWSVVNELKGSGLVIAEDKI